MKPWDELLRTNQVISVDEWRQILASIPENESEASAILFRARKDISSALTSALLKALKKVLASKSYYEYVSGCSSTMAVLERGPVWLARTISLTSGLWMERIRHVVNSAYRSDFWFDTVQEMDEMVDGEKNETYEVGEAWVGCGVWRWVMHARHRLSCLLQKFVRVTRAPVWIRDVERYERLISLNALQRLERILSIFIGYHHEMISSLYRDKALGACTGVELRIRLSQVCRMNEQFFGEMASHDLDGMERVTFSHFGARLMVAESNTWLAARMLEELAFIECVVATIPGSVPFRTTSLCSSLSTKERETCSEIMCRMEGTNRGRILLDHPSHWERHWLGYLVGFSGLLGTYRYLTSFPTSLTARMTDISTGLSAFWRERIATPLSSIYREVFLSSYKTSMDPCVVRAERDSLKRMVVEFTRETYRTASESERAMAEIKAANGDLSPVMEVYERQIRNPVINLFAGDVIRALLIQVQKLKVDVEEEMVVVDALVRANELNLQIAAAVPGILIIGLLATAALGALGKWWQSVRSNPVDRFGGSGLWWTASGAERRSAAERARWLLRDVERVLTRGMKPTDALYRQWMFSKQSDGDHQPEHPFTVEGILDAGNQQCRSDVPESFETSSRHPETRDGTNTDAVVTIHDSALQRYENTGHVLLVLSELEMMIASHGKQLGVDTLARRDAFVREDLEDLRSCSLSVAQKLQTLERMRWTYLFFKSG